MKMPHWLRKILVIVTILVFWQIAAIWANTPLILPTFTETLAAFIKAIMAPDDNLLRYVWETSRSLFAGFCIGTLVATILTVLATNTRVGEEFLVTITSAFAPLPAVAVFPLSLMWFGISYTSVVFIAVFATVFPVAVSMTQGFRAVSDTLRNVGRNLGMSRIGLTCRILIPAALPAILSGLRSGFSNGFRALVAVEMVIGTATGAGGVGWFVMSSKQNLDIPLVYAGIFSIMAVGLVFEGFFALIEKYTVRRWGMLQ